MRVAKQPNKANPAINIGETKTKKQTKNECTLGT